RFPVRVPIALQAIRTRTALCPCISSRASFARYQTQMNRVRECGCHNWDRRSGILCCDSLTSSGCKDDLGFEPDQLLRQGWQPLCITISETVDDIEVAALEVTELSHPLQKSVDKPYGGPTSAPTQPGNEWPLLHTRRERPRCRRAAEQRDERAPLGPASGAMIAICTRCCYGRSLSISALSAASIVRYDASRA